ncbi:phage gene 29 protein family protein [Gordonia rubripertincta]|uniref:phage gene 29 protein family protein n=1 Tax=Gordonia rubripertincta TaxID=36822 RepID=UPI0015F8A0F8|nr:hypothetical protein [Gordonia rubripertincta]QMU22497.1 hypothetical protein H3V45_08530 [Gordonia rubripertincta]
MTSTNPRDIPEQLAAAENEKLLAQVATATGEDLEFVRDQVGKLLAMHVGLPGVNSAPLVTGPNHYFETACHLFECGARVPAEPIKTYQAATEVDGRNGRWVYHDEATAPEAYADRAKRQVLAERAAFREALAERRKANGDRSRARTGTMANPTTPPNRKQRRQRG